MCHTVLCQKNDTNSVAFQHMCCVCSRDNTFCVISETLLLRVTFCFSPYLSVLLSSSPLMPSGYRRPLATSPGSWRSRSRTSQSSSAREHQGALSTQVRTQLSSSFSSTLSLSASFCVSAFNIESVVVLLVPWQQH